MKMGLSVVLLGHVNFMLGALVHGVVLRHITLHKQALAMEYAISNVSAITSGLVVSGQTRTLQRCRGQSLRAVTCEVKGPFRGFVWP